MSDIKELKDNIIDKIKNPFQIKQMHIDFKEQFYYPKYIHFLKFNIEQYNIDGLGNMAILNGRAWGVMKLITVVFTPNYSKDIPFVIIDFIKVGSKITVFVEFYLEHMIRRDDARDFESKLKYLSSKYNNIENYIEEPNWYTYIRSKYSPLKKGRKKDESILCEMVLEYLEIYLDCVCNCKLANSNANKHLEELIDDLIYKGNPSTSILEKSLGKEETERLFKEVIFKYGGN